MLCTEILAIAPGLVACTAYSAPTGIIKPRAHLHIFDICCSAYYPRSIFIPKRDKIYCTVCWTQLSLYCRYILADVSAETGLHLL